MLIVLKAALIVNKIMLSAALIVSTYEIIVFV